jgi:outer membrane protein assembly factor BamA
MHPATTIVTVAVLVSGGWLHTARAQEPQGAASATAPDSLEGRVVREIRIGPAARPSTAEIVRRHLASRQGAPFRRAALSDDRRQLEALRLFSHISIRAIAAGDEVVLDVEVTETLRLLPFIALSVTEENGVSAGPAFRGINLLGRGSLSSGTMQFGGATAVGVRVERPTVTPGAWDLDTKVLYRSRRNELFDFDETSTTIGVSAAWNRTSTLQLGGRAEYIWFDTGSAEVAGSPDGPDHLPALGVFATWNSLDSQANPRVGWLGSIDVGHQFGDATFRTLTLDGRRYQPLSARSTVSLVGFAAFQSGIVGQSVPGYLQFGLGGANSVRGWSLGSRLGKNQAIATLEYAYAVVPVRPFTVFGLNLYGGMQLAAFSDVGLAWNDHLAASDAIDGYGFGMRLLLPFVDVIRLDLAFGEPDQGARFCFGINLKADKQRDRVR